MINDYLKDLLHWESPKLEEREAELKNQEELKKHLALSQSRLKEIGIYQKAADKAMEVTAREELIEKARKLREIEDEGR